MEEFIKLVLNLRNLQKAFFKNHERNTLQACKTAEKEVDEYIKKYLNKDVATQKSIFDED